MAGAPQVYSLEWAKNQPPKPVVPSVSDEIRVEAQEKPGKTPNETDPATTSAQNQKAKNLLAQKNRKCKHGPIMELPFDPTMEEGSKWTLTGFSPVMDGDWIVHEVIFTFQGKEGSRLEIELMDPASLHIAESTLSPTQKKSTIPQPNIGKQEKPTPKNPSQDGGRPFSWLPEE